MSEQSQDRLHGLDFLRALAILLVLLFHYEIYYGLPEVLRQSGLIHLGGFGWSGVDLFFVLSGYLIGNKLFGDVDRDGSISFSGFYLNRALRILPAYFAALAIYFSFAELQEGRGLQPLWRFLTFTQNLPIELATNTFSHAWSLCVEEHFYLLLPAILALLFARRLQRHGGYLVLGLLALGLVIRYVNWSEFVEPLQGRARLGAAFKYIYYPTFTRLDGLTVGVAIAALFRYQPAIRDRITPYGNGLLVAGLVVLALGYALFDGNIISPKFTRLGTTLAGFPLVALGYGLLVVAALSPGSLLHRLRFRPAATLATLSFSIYLVHKMSNHWIVTQHALYADLSALQVFGLCLIAAVLAGLALHLAVEKPFLVLRDRLAAQRAADTSTG